MAPAPQRLKRRREFLHVARTGRKWAAPGLVLQALNRHAGEPISDAAPLEEGEIRVGFTVTRKVGNAVVRNRTRRRLRAAAETIIPAHAAPGHDFVVIGRAGTIGRPFPDLLGDLEAALRKLGAWKEETPVTGGRI
ncbi:MAG: ribonuclease P protein component [Rhodospirillaceae bacterium]|nr:ribonuclease P protein component [Rhodospirillaceae bacterium]MBT5455125.1 ribonuclease P protein component [Rhodospirillaceae bacterium]